MRRKALRLAAAAFGLAMAACPLLAHHSFAAEYDSTKPTKLVGTVTKVEWMNPHIYYYLDVKDAAGKVTNYAVEGGTPGSLYRQGWRKDSLKIGDVVTVEGYLAKNGSNTVNGRKVILPDGKRVFGGSADDGGPGAEAYGKSEK
jgi:hypothetical protein